MLDNDVLFPGEEGYLDRYINEVIFISIEIGHTLNNPGLLSQNKELHLQNELAIAKQNLKEALGHEMMFWV